MFRLAPVMPMLYFTAALVPLIVMPVTVAFADSDIGDPACPLMTDANFCPFCSSETLVAAEVFPPKNDSQLAVIAAWAPLPLAGSAAVDDEAEDEDAGAEVPGAEDDPPEDEAGAETLDVDELLHAAAVISARPDATAIKIRPAVLRDRMTRLPVRSDTV